MWTLVFKDDSFLNYESEEKLFEDISKVTKYKGISFKNLCNFVFLENMDIHTWNKLINHKTHFAYYNHPKGDFDE